MKGNVTVTVETTSVFGGQKDVLRFTGRGTVTPTDYGYQIRYTAANDLDGAVVDSEVKLEREGRRAVVINESGASGYGLLLDPKAVTATRIDGDGGALTLNVTTQNVSWELGRREGTVDLGYTLLMGAAPLSALQVHMELKEERETK